MFKCIVIDQGVQVGLNENYTFIYSDKAYFITEVPGNRVTITRRVNTDFHEVFQSPLSMFVDGNGAPIATTVAEFRTFMSQQGLKVKAGDGIGVTADNVVSVKAGGPSVLGGYKVGTGLNVDGEGRLSATASSEVTKVVANEAAMLALQAESLRPYRVIRLDTKRLYYLNAGTSPSVLANWFEGPSIETAVLSFNARTGMVVPEFGDYKLNMVPATDVTTSMDYRLVIDDGKLYLENIADSGRIQVGANATLDQLIIDFNALKAVVSEGDGAITNQLSELKGKVLATEMLIGGAEDGLSRRVERAEEAVSGFDQRVQTIEDSYVNKSEKGVAEGVATLDADGKVPASQLPAGQASGVLSVFGRTGHVVQENGDIVTSKITETEERQFISNEDRSRWNNGVVSASQKAKLDSLRTNTENDSRYIQTAQKAVNNGVATLDASGKVPMSQLNVSGLTFKGAWDASTNTPKIVDGTGTTGDFYKVSVVGTQNFGNGSYTFSVGDWVIFAGGVWQRIGVTESVSMVNGQVGNIVLTAADVGALPLSYTPSWVELTGKPAFNTLYQPKHRGTIGPAIAASRRIVMSAQSAANGTYTKITALNGGYDQFAIHNSGNFVPPSWAKYIRVTASMTMDGTPSGGASLAVYRNNSLYARCYSPVVGGSVATYVDTGIFQCTSSDSFDVRIWHDTGASRTIGQNRSWVQIELFE